MFIAALALFGLLNFELVVADGPCSGKLDYDCGEGTPRCIPSAWHCDNIRDCSNGKDEANCNYIFCPANTFKCKSRECLATNTRCNGRVDCADGSDESSCFLTSPTPNNRHNAENNNDGEVEGDSSIGGEVSLDGAGIANPQPNNVNRNRNPTAQSVGSSPHAQLSQCSTNNAQLLNFTGTYRDDGNGVEGQRLYVAVEKATNERKVFTLEEAFNKDAWSICQYLASKLK